jgi:hypothetical protein
MLFHCSLSYGTWQQQGCFIKVFSLFILDTRITARVPKLLMSLLLETIQSHENQAAQHDLPANFSPQAIENQPSPPIMLPLWV